MARFGDDGGHRPMALIAGDSLVSMPPLMRALRALSAAAAPLDPAVCFCP
jgi:hypothetical protein